MTIDLHFGCNPASTSKSRVSIWSWWEHRRLRENLEMIRQGVCVWEDQVQEFRNISCLVTQLEATDSTADSERFQLCTETKLILKCSAYC